jgi:hypothetical protein
VNMQDFFGVAQNWAKGFNNQGGGAIGDLAGGGWGGAFAPVAAWGPDGKPIISDARNSLAELLGTEDTNYSNDYRNKLLAQVTGDKNLYDYNLGKRKARYGNKDSRRKYRYMDKDSRRDYKNQRRSIKTAEEIARLNDATRRYGIDSRVGVISGLSSYLPQAFGQGLGGANYNVTHGPAQTSLQRLMPQGVA